MKWISVSDTPLPLGTTVLVTDGFGYSLWRTDPSDSAYVQAVGYIGDDCIPSIRPYQVTHWIALPEEFPPKQEVSNVG